MTRTGPDGVFGWLIALAITTGTVSCGGEGEIEQPAPLYGDVPIEYPLHLWDQDMEGETLLRVRVTDTGAVDSVEVMQTSGHGDFDAAAVDGAKALRFTPARQDGKRIRVWARVPVHFSKKPMPDTLRIRN
ncbi:MAG: energy transducer TonB [Thioalkalivibrio sp.]|nr:energy transducer TonB [Thioalkalivibrio sp.]